MKASFEGSDYFNQLPCSLALIDESCQILWTNELWNSSIADLKKGLSESRLKTKNFIKDFVQSTIWLENFQACLKGKARSFQDEAVGTSLIWRMSLANIPRLKKDKKMAWVFFQPERGLLPETIDQRANLIQQAKLKELSEMAASIAHEVNNPLAVIYARASFLRDRMGRQPLSEEAIMEGLDKICAQSDRIGKIIRGLRSFSRDSSRDPFCSTSVSALIADATALVNESIRSHGVELKIENKKKDLAIECRPTQILQVLVNLLKNAVEAVAETEFPKVEISVRSPTKKYVEIRVKDNGPGVPEDIQNKIFHPFFTTKKIGAGTGLGLSVSLKIIETHKGQLFLDTKKGRSCFLIKLPVKQITTTKKKV